MVEISKLLLKTTYYSLDALFKASEADIRMHDLENVPDQSILFVINHFTRFETALIPYAFFKYLNKPCLTLADAPLFSGGFGKVLNKLGAISTEDPERDRIIISTLLKGDNSVVIFPEGQMIKDKKLVEKGKFMVYNMGIRRPPHTGSAIIALKAQYYREKIRYLVENGCENELGDIKKEFFLKDADITKLLSRETYIVPVNITYYPIRSKDNAIKKFVEKFAKKIPERFEEELEVEGTMLSKGVDIDINFGKAIQVSEYIKQDCITHEKVCRIESAIAPIEKKVKKAMKLTSVKIMYKYMDSIYRMTTINHDHIFSYIIAKTWKKRISETEFKNRAFLVIDKIRSMGLTNFHTTLSLKQYYLLSDDYHAKYTSFIEAGVSSGLITVENGYIVKNRKKFNKVYNFHTIRKDNIFEVLKNEIEPVKILIRQLKINMIIPHFFIKWIIRKKFIEQDKNIFSRDYREYFITGESKPENIGSPFFLKKIFAKKGILLIHGYMAAPREVRTLAEILHKKGYSVYGVRLRGHGTSPEDLASRNWIDWYDSVSRGHIILKNSVKKIVIAGFSTGAGLALLQASNKNEFFSGIISISAPIKLKSIAAKFSPAISFWNRLLDKVHISKGKMEFVKNDPENPEINYTRNPVSGISELEELMKTTSSRLGNITIPALVIQAENDPVVDRESAKIIFKKISSQAKELFFVNSSKHGIINGEDLETVAKKIEVFLDENF